MRVLAVDPGVWGALAVIDDANGVAVPIDIIDVPTVGVGAGERVAVAALRDWIGRHRPDFALIERAQSMPRQGSSSGFKYGRAVGAIEATIVLHAVPLKIVEPTAWKRFWGLPAKEKEKSRQRALEVFPAAHALLARKRDHNRAEAALIGAYGLRRSRLTPALTTNEYTPAAAPAAPRRPAC